MRQLPKTIAADTWLWNRLHRAWCHAGMQTRAWMWPLFLLAVAHAALWGRLIRQRGDAWVFWPYRNPLPNRIASWQARRAWRGYDGGEDF